MKKISDSQTANTLHAEHASEIRQKPEPILQGALARLCSALAAFFVIALVSQSAFAAPLTIGGTIALTASSPHFIRPESACGPGTEDVQYSVVEFYVDGPGQYVFRTTGNEETGGHIDDPFLVVYSSPFNPANQSNCLGADDDSGVGLESQLTLTLAVGNVYTAVITTFSSGANGLVTWSADGPADMHYLIAVKAIATSAPTPSGGTLSLQLTNPGTARWVAVLQGAPAPDGLQVLAGRDSTSALAPGSGSIVVSAADTNTTGPITGLQPSTAYDIYAVVDNDGVPSSVRQTSLVTLAPPAPSVISFSPANNAMNIAPGSSIALTFDQAMSFGSGQIQILDLTTDGTESIQVNGVDTRLVLSAAGTVLTITPGTPLQPGHSYTLRITSGALTSSGGAYPGFRFNSALTFSTEAIDTAPDPFPFAPSSASASASLSTPVDSAPVVISGTNSPAPISVVNGSYSINGGPFTSAAGTINSGDSVVVRVISSSAFETTTSGTLIIGGVGSAFSVTTHAVRSLIRADAFTRDDRCDAGGVAIHFGDDLDDSGVLDPSEFVTNSFVCNGEPGANGLVTLVTTEPLVDDFELCPTGKGILFKSGIDLNKNGLLETLEVDPAQTVAMCELAGALVETSRAAPDPTVCPTGGIQITSGTDLNGDGALGTGEPVTTKFVCDGIDSISRTSTLASGSVECAYGGVKLELGLDKNGDAELSDEEVTLSEVLCTASGVAIRTTTLRTGSTECPTGGVRIESGIDLDGDKSLGDDEVQSTQVVCSGTAGAAGPAGSDGRPGKDVQPAASVTGGGGCSVQSGSTSAGRAAWLAGLLLAGAALIRRRRAN